MKHLFSLLLLILVLVSCKDKVAKKPEKITKPKPKGIVLISKYAPKAYKHYLKQDSIGKQTNEEPGPYSPIKATSFSYYDSQNSINYWRPKVDEIDTLIIPHYRDYLELSTRNRYTSIPNTYLVKNGDTVIIEYKNKIPVASISNRDVNDIELNYNNHRVKELFDNKYPSHYLIFLGGFLDSKKSIDDTAIYYYKKAIVDEKKEFIFLDSLYKEKKISKDNYLYRKEILSGLSEKHKNKIMIKEWLAKSQPLTSNEDYKTSYSLDLSQTDSLMTFSYFRDYINDISKYNLSLIRENNVGSGSSYIDSRIRFDSILKDKKLNQTAKNFLLVNAFHNINMNFKTKDKKKYFNKLVENTTNSQKIKELQEQYKLDFSKSDRLILTTVKNDTTTFSNVLKKNKGKWLYVDFWASWCIPCRETMPASVKLNEELKNENIAFIYIGLNDNKENWKNALQSNGISTSQNYFTENGNISKVVEELGINTIPHYIIYNPMGELVNGYANRPGKGAKEQFKKLMTSK